MDQNEILERLIKMKNIIIKITKALRPNINGLNSTDIYVLMKIAKNEGITMTKLSEITGLSSTLITFTVDNLEKLSFVERRKGLDRRIQTLILTEKGKSLKNEIEKISKERFSEITKNMNDKEIKELIDLFDKIFEIMKKVENIE
ncbi:MAG: MarR family winged helix-turn-helix transcriptional regulator [Thermoplasmata archaeon]|nr:MarR family transcriptional regulator [Thermoplasmata archaeon]